MDFLDSHRYCIIFAIDLPVEHLDEFPIGSYLKVKFSLKTLSLFWYLSEEKKIYII